MQTVIKWTRERICVVLILSLSLLWPWSVQAGQETGSPRVVILPFEIGAPGGFDYVRDGLRGMLAGRLATTAGVVELDYSLFESELKKLGATPAKEDVGALLRKLQVDYLVSGTVYSLHKSLRLKLSFYPATKEKEIKNFVADAKEPAGIFVAIDGVASEVADKLFGIKPKAAKTDDQTRDGLSGFETAHPERIFKKGIYSASLLGVGAGTLITSKNIKQSPKLPFDIVAFDVADINNDGKEELIVSSRSSIRLYQFQGEDFDKIGQFDLPGDLKVHAINIADLDRDNTYEIIVSGSRKYQPASAIIEFKENGSFSYKFENIPYYLRPVDLGDGAGMILVGQRGVVDIAEEGQVVEPGIYQIHLAGSTLESGRKLVVPKTVNLFDFMYVDLDGDKVSELVVIDAREKMLVYSHDNKLLWVSGDDFGGSVNYFGPPTVKDDDAIERQLVFIPTRILVTDIDQDNKPELLIGRNKRSTVSEYRFLPNSRDYDSGFLSCLSWNGKSMEEQWRTSMTKGYLADYRFELEKGEKGQKPIGAKLWIGQVRENKLLNLFSAGGGSRIQEYHLEFPEKADKKKSE